MQQHLLLFNSRGGPLPQKRSVLCIDKVGYNVFHITNQIEKPKKQLQVYYGRKFLCIENKQSYFKS